MLKWIKVKLHIIKSDPVFFHHSNPERIFDISDISVKYRYITDWNRLDFLSLKSMTETIVQKMKKVCWWKKKSILIYLFMLEIVFFNRFQVIQGTRIKALLLQLFFSKLKLTTEEKMLMISSNSNLMCVTSGKQIMQIFIKHSRIYSNYYFLFLFFTSLYFCKWMT